jgi:hypothetical protein
MEMPNPDVARTDLENYGANFVGTRDTGLTMTELVAICWERSLREETAPRIRIVVRLPAFISVQSDLL